MFLLRLMLCLLCLILPLQAQPIPGPVTPAPPVLHLLPVPVDPTNPLPLAPAEDPRPTPPSLVATPRPLTISGALTMTFQRNSELAAAQAEVRQFRAAYEQAGSLPTAAFTAGMMRGDGAASLNSFSGLKRDEFLQFQQNFFPFGYMKKAQLVAWLNVQGSMARLQLEKMTLLRQTKDAFYNLLAAQERIRVYNANLVLAKQIFETTEKGTDVKREDLLAARVQRNQVEQALITTAGEVQAAQADLAPLLGLASGDQLLVSGDIDTDYGDLQLKDLLALGEQSPALEAARQATLSGHEQVKLSSMLGAPSPSLLAIYDFRTPSYVIGGLLSFPLDYGQIGWDMLAKTEAAVGLEAHYRSLTLAIMAEIQKAYATFIAADRNSASYEEDVLLPQEEAVRLVQAQFAKRKVDYNQVLLAQKQLSEIRLENLRQRVLARLSLDALEAAVGTPIEKLTPEPEGLR